MCDGDHFEARRPTVHFVSDLGTDAPQEIEMARAVKMTKTRIARWISAFRQRGYYDTLE